MFATACGIVLCVCGQSPAEKDLLKFITDEIRGYEVLIGKDEKAVLQENSLLQWSQPIQDPHNGGVFVWTVNGRPEVLTRIVRFEAKPRVDHTFSVISSRPVTARQNGQTIWSPRRRYAELKRFPGAAPPAESPVRRLQQLRSMAGEFDSELLHEGRVSYRLRVMPRPLYRYHNDEIRDGALLGLALGNDAKVIALIETRRDQNGDWQWHYTLAPLTLHGVVMKLAGADVLRIPYRNSPYNSAEPHYIRMRENVR